MLTTTYVPGAPNWTDLGTPDIEAASAFYGSLFGWAFLSAGPDAGGYGMFTLGEKTVAAVGPLTEEGAASAWTVYFQTQDVDATAKAVQQAGGSVRFGPFDVFTQGRMAGFADLSGVQFAVWQPGETKGLDAVNEINTLAWTELLTDDAERAKRFYSTIFGWEVRDMPIDAGMTYSVAGPAGGGEEAAHSGIMAIGDEMRQMGLTPQWGVYFEVADCDAVVALADAKGGSVVVPAMTMEGVGRMATLADPFGARFSVITSAAPEAS
jgi:predicted enzyme related to lactoylglutathione lyase